MTTISFARDVPSPDLVPVEELADCAATVLAREGRTILTYGAGAGYTPLRELIGEWFGVHPGRVLLTNGALQGLDLLARATARGQTVLTEYPAYDRAYGALLAAGASIVTAPADAEGLDPTAVEGVLMTERKPAFILTMPTFNNPTGATTSEERRQRLVTLAAQREFALVEYDPYRLLRLDGVPLPALFDLTGTQAIYISSFSKTIAPGLRVGWLIVPERLGEELAAAATGTYITPVQLGEAVVHEFITRGSFAPNLARVVDLLRARRDAMLAALDEHFAGARWTRPEGGYFVWLELPFGTDAREVIARADGVAAVAGTEFTATSNFVRLSYSFAAPDEIAEGVARLASAV